MWRVMILSVDPTSWPPINTIGTGGLRPNNLLSTFSISLPLGSLSSSWMAGLTPSSQNSVLIVWHMQHELKLKITTGYWEVTANTLSILVTDEVAKKSRMQEIQFSEIRKLFQMYWFEVCGNSVENVTCEKDNSTNKERRERAQNQLNGQQKSHLNRRRNKLKWFD